MMVMTYFHDVQMLFSKVAIFDSQWKKWNCAEEKSIYY